MRSNMVTFNGVEYDARHGGPFDRGAADSYYRRTPRAHYFLGATHQSIKIGLEGMSKKQILEYHAGFDWNYEQGIFKDYD